jgi:general secretion pathway protein B
MSYILEALKKSKQERQGGETPHIHTVHAVPSFKARSSKMEKRGVLLGGVAVALSIGGFFYYIFSEDTPRQVEDSFKSITVRDIEIRSQFIEQAEEASVVVQNSDFMPARPALTDESHQPIRITRDRFKKIVPRTVKNVGAEPSEEIQDLPYRVQLPPEIQKEIPQFKFAGHTYADDPKRRMIIINNQILREGDSVDSDTKLVNIVWEGVVLSYKGVSFRQKIH